MRDFTLNSNKPISISIAADPRTSTTNYLDDQIWELTLNSGEPQALALQTTYGLRATKMRLFPRFTIGHDTSTTPAKFSKAPLIQKIYPNYISLAFSPFESIAVVSEYWVANSHQVAGRIHISNISAQNQQLKFELVALLTPAENGSRAVPIEKEGIQVLSGSTEEIFPVIFITGGASSVNSPYPALVNMLDLPPGNSRQFTWCHVAQKTVDDSFDEARAITNHNWDAEIARVELQNSNQIEIYTGSEEWDQIFLFSQKTAYGLLFGKTSHQKYLSYVTTRIPDDGYSPRGDGSDYGPQWSGQTPIDSYYLANILLPSSPSIMKDILRNHLDAYNENGELDWKAGLGGQISNRLATPLLASIAWKIYQVDQNLEFLHEIYPQLINYLNSWFSSGHDHDGDGIPEWDHPLQAGFEDHPIFARWHTKAQGVEITTSESPSLCAFLYNECHSMIDIAKLLNINEHIESLGAKAENLRYAVENAWSEELSGYTYWDRDSHQRSKKVILGQLRGSGTIEIDQSFAEPQRLIFQIQTTHETTRKTQIIIHGHSPSGKHRIEIVPPEKILWFPSFGTATSEQIYQSIGIIEVNGLDKADSMIISNSGLLAQDITTFLPIWAKIPSNVEVQLMVENSITNPKKFWLDYGIPGCPASESIPEDMPCHAVYLPWCLFIGEGLLSYGFRTAAMELVTKIMNSIQKSIDADGCFSYAYSAKSGGGSGDNDALWGLAPLGLFLESLGLRIITPWKIYLSGINPYPWPVTVKFRGTTILRGHEKTQIIFTDGQTILVTDPEPCLVSLE
ncbi:MAG: MGH1-like glycoside hydrolase domain-containing protein [Anaerolineales bacterium]|jgi:hypothetical protein